MAKINRQKLLIIAVFAVILILVSLFFIFVSTGTETEDQLEPSTTSSPNQEEAYFSKELPYQVEESLFIQEVYPEPPVFKSIWVTEPIQITFNRPADVQQMRIEIVPDIPFLLTESSYKENTINIVPREGWQSGQEFLVRIYSEQQQEPLEFKIRREIPQPGDPEYPEEENLPPGGI